MHSSSFLIAFLKGDLQMKKIKGKANGHSWRFFRAGGFDQVRLDSGKDLLAIEQLDQKLWVALACPVDNVHFDKRTLTLIDTDKDQRVRAVELIAAIKWTVSLLKNPDTLLDSSDKLLLDSINDSTDEGKLLIAAAKNSLAALGRADEKSISVSDTEAIEKALSNTVNNGDGVITEENTADEKLKLLIRDIIALCGNVTDRSGKPGINAEKVETFFTQIQAYETWLTEAEKDTRINPLGDRTAKAAEALIALKDKVEDYFTRCDVAEFDNRALNALNGQDKEYAFDRKMLSIQSDQIAEFPLSRIEAGKALPLTTNVNPAWAEKTQTFVYDVIEPLYGKKEILTKSEWRQLLSAFEPYIDWQKRKPGMSSTSIDTARLKEWLSGGLQEKLKELISRDASEASTFDALISLEKLVRFNRDLYRLSTNFVNFKDFYAKGGPAIFQAGTLYLDQRSCNMCIKVDDINKHSVMSAMAGTYLVYCECKRKAGAEKMNILAAITSGDSENLIVGRNGVFYDRSGNDWDASIVKIIENPISIRQAFWLPYKSLVRMIESQVAKRAMAAEAQSAAKLQQTAITTANVDKIKPPEPPKKLDVGIVAALGVAAGALGTFVATILGYVAGIIKLGPFAVIGALLALLLVVSGPSIVLAYIKLRKRNLGPILDASGWAVNAKARINVPFGAVLTNCAALPPGSQRDPFDPYAEKKSPWPKLIATALLVYAAYAALNHLGYINEWTKGKIGLDKSKSVNVIAIEKDKAGSGIIETGTKE